jgi:hypothetical protein
MLQPAAETNSKMQAPLDAAIASQNGAAGGFFL